MRKPTPEERAAWKQRRVRIDARIDDLRRRAARIQAEIDERRKADPGHGQSPTS